MARTTPADLGGVLCGGRALGIPEGLVRYSVGIENAKDLLWDLEQALAAR